MDKPIGVFDSGIGGLTVVRQIINLLPNESIVYLGDTARVPYGNRDSETIKKYSLELVGFMNQKRVKAIVVACNTISAVALADVKKAAKVPVIDVINPTVEIVAENFLGKRIAVVATRATIGSKVYEDKFKKRKINITTTPAPLFVPFAEEGLLTGEIARKVVGLYLGKLKTDVLILGSTHYPLLRNMIGEVLGPKTALIDTGYSAALELSKVLKKNNLLSGSNPSYEFYVTDDTKRTEQVAELFFENELPAKLKKIKL